MAETKVARILVQEGGQKAVADHRAVEGVEIGRAGALEVAFRTPAEAGAVVLRFRKTRDDECDPELIRIDGGTKCEPDLLARGHGRGIAAIGDVERRQDAADALLFLLFDLLGGLLVLALLRRGRRRGGLGAGTALLRAGTALRAAALLVAGRTAWRRRRFRSRLLGVLRWRGLRIDGSEVDLRRGSVRNRGGRSNG